MKLRTTNPFLCQIAVLAALVAAPLAHAADGTWLGNAGNWADNTNTPTSVWSGGTIANGTDFTAFFTGVDIAVDRVITLTGIRTIGNITFTDATTSSHNLTITGSTLTLDRTSGVPIIDVTQAGRQLTIASIIAGSDGLEKIGAGTLVLKGTNTFSGGLTIKAGTVTNENGGTGGNFLGSGTVTLGDSGNTGAAATLNFFGGNFTSTNAISVVGTGVSTLQVTGWHQVLNGNVTLSNNLTVVTNNAFGSNMAFGSTGAFTGTGNLIIQSNAINNLNTSSNITIGGSGGINMIGTITNSGSGSSSGTGNIHTTISALIGTNVTGIIQNSTNSQLLLTNSNSTYTSNITVTAGTLSANTTKSALNPITSVLGNTQAAGRTLTIASAGTLNFGAMDVMGNGGSVPVLKIIANGGTIKNSGNLFNTLGPVDLNGGTLSSVGGADANFPSFALRGTVTVGGSAASTISSTGSNSQMGLEPGTGTTFDVADAVSGSVSDLNVTGVLANFNSGSGFLIKSGVGTMTLSGVNTYTGGTRIDNGTLALANVGNNALVNTGAVNVNGGTLALGTSTETVGAVTLTSGSITGTGAGTLTGTGSAYDVRSGSVSAKLGGTVGLTKTTGGTVSLSGVNTYSGATSVNEGTLLLSSTGSTASGSAITVAAGTATGVPLAKLGGTGTIGGTVALTAESALGFKNGGVLAPAAAASGTQLKVTGTTNFGTGSLFEWNMSATTPGTNPGVVANSGSYGQLAGTGTISGSNAVFNIVLGAGNAFTDAFWNSNKSWTDIFTGAGAPADLTSLFSSISGAGLTWADNKAAFGDITPGGDGGYFTINSSTLNWTAVPEPTSALAGLLLTAGLLRRRRK